MSGKNRRLVAYGPVEVEKQPVDVGDFSRIIDRLRGIYGIYSRCIEQNRKMSTSNLARFRITMVLTDYAQKPPGHSCMCADSLTEYLH